jgi:hypothetical protein
MHVMPSSAERVCWYRYTTFLLAHLGHWIVLSTLRASSSKVEYLLLTCCSSARWVLKNSISDCSFENRSKKEVMAAGPGCGGCARCFL